MCDRLSLAFRLKNRGCLVGEDSPPIHKGENARSAGARITIALALFSKQMKWLFNSSMLWGAVLGWLIVSSTMHLLDTARHKGPGIVHYGLGERGPGWSEKGPESQYKRHNYVMFGVTLSIGLMLWFVVARAYFRRRMRQGGFQNRFGRPNIIKK